MSGTINNGLSALLAAQRALQATSNNIANANTEGFVRQRVDFVEQPGTPLGGYTLGSGVSVGSVTRIYDQFLTDNLRTATSLEQRADAFNDFAARINTVLGNPDTGVNTAVQRFFNQVEALGRDPTSAAQRNQLLLEGENLAERLQQMDGQLSGISSEVNSRLGLAAGTINTLAGQVADLNGQIMAAGSSAASDLLDRRDVALKQLGAQINITTIRQNDGSVNVLVGSGQSLVLGTNSARLATMPDQYDGSRMQLAISTNNGPLQNISGKVSGGTVGGLLSFRNDVLDSARRDLGLLATGLGDAFNTQHRAGVDQAGNMGGDFFALGSPVVSGSTANTGTAAASAAITDASALAGRDYELRFNGSSWSVIDNTAHTPVTATGSGTGADPLLFAGLSFSVSGSPAAGDKFMLRPVANAADEFRVMLTEPAAIAAAAPLSSRIAAGNASQANVSSAVVTNSADPKLRTPATIRFVSPTSYVVFTGGGADQVGPLPYTSGADISFAGWTTRVSGTPATGDEFLVEPTTGGSGDNSNALALASVSQRGFFANGTQSVIDLGADIVASVGSTANRASNEVLIQQSLREQSEIDLENVSGVNLDEEAANMLRYQDAYLAASKVVSIADGLFQNLLQIVGR
ncbi:MAG: flagellar hook-associated protein FlgK [Gammaproteobacteria bacterium]